MFASNVKIELIEGIFMESGIYQDMGLRPYIFSAGGNAHNQFLEATAGGVNLDPVTVSSVANQILTPSAQTVQQVPIVNGWQRKRFMFMMRFRIYQNSTHGMHVRNDVVVQGHTSHVGVNMASDSLDPDMLLYLNSITRLEPRVINDQWGSRTIYQPKESSQVIFNEPQQQMGQTVGSRHTMRPQDLYGVMGSSALGTHGVNVYDTRMAFSNNQCVTKSNRKNASSPYYLSNVAKSYYYSNPDDYTGVVSAPDDIDLHDAYAGARQKSMELEGPLSTDLFFMALGENYQRMGYITAGELAQLTPNINDPSYTRVILDRSQNMVKSSILPTTDGYNNTTPWGGADTETLWANILIQSVPAIMVDFLITGCAFTITNRTTDGQMALAFSYAQPFIKEQDIGQALPRLEQRIISEVMMGLTRGNSIDFALSMEVSISSDSRIRLSIAGQSEQIYMAPSFCDSLYAPVSTFDSQDIFRLSNDMSGFIDNIKNDTSAFANYSITPTFSQYH